MNPHEPISVLHVLGTVGGHRGGSAAATLAIATATRDAGDRAAILTTCGTGEVLPEPVGIEIVGCPRQGPVCFSAPVVAWLWRNVRRFDLVEVHEIFAFPTLAVWAVARLRGVPFVVHPHGSLEPHVMRRHAWLKDLLRPGLRRMLRHATAVWLAAAREESSLAHLGTGFRTVVSALPVPAPAHHGDREAFRARYGLDHEHRVVLFLGRLGPEKGLPRLISAFESVADDEPEARLVIAGSGDEDFVAGIRERVAASRHGSWISMVGFLSGQEKADALHGADLFALHSDNENVGIAPVEALHCGTPVLLSDQVCIAGEIAAAGAAQVVPATDERALAERMAFLLTDPIELRRLCAGTAIAVAPYVPERVARRDATVRRELLASHRGASVGR